jgi:LPS-assembly lipoprotein
MALFSVLLSMSACGYHLRGSIEMPESLKTVYVSGASSTLQSEISAFMRASKGKIVTTLSEAGIVVKILKEDMRTRVLSIGTTGKSAESELNYYLRFQFFDKQDNPLKDEQTIELAREYFNDQTAVLAKSSEAQLITSEIYKQASRMLMAQARVAIDNPTPGPVKASTQDAADQEQSK